MNIKLEGGPYRVEWVNPRNPSDRRTGSANLDGHLSSPTEGSDWLGQLIKN